MIKCVLSALNTAEPPDPSSLKNDYDATEDLLKEALIEEIKSELYDKESNENIKSKSNTTNSEKASESRLESSWIDMNGESRPLSQDPNENDVLNSRESDFNKRDEHYESLEKKSQRSTYIPPPRKNFYATSEEIDISASEEFINRERPVYRKPIRIEDHTDDYDSEKRDTISDVIHAASDSFIDAFPPFIRRPIEVPPWRYTEDKPQPKPVTTRRHLPPIVEPPIVVKDESSEQPPEPLIPRAALHSHQKTFKPIPRMPAPMRMPHRPPMNFNTDSKFKPLPRSKPWVSDFKTDSIAPKFSMNEDKSFSSSHSFGKPVRQQFHEQVSINTFTFM